MATKKQEQQINRLFEKVKTLNLCEDEVRAINMRGFLYSVGRINVLQVTAYMTALCLKNGVDFNEIADLLKD